MKLKFHPEYIMLVLFLAALVLYLNMDGIPLTHPGNIKAADPFYHAIVAETIVKTGEWHFYPAWLSQNNQRMVNIQPPLLYMNTAALSIFSDIPVWAVMYFLVCLAAALSVLFLYLACTEIFGSKLLSLIATSFAAFPLSLQAWLYGMYIGFWIQVTGYMFLMAYLWLFVKHWKKYETWHLPVFGVILSAVLLVHPQDLVVLALPTLLIVAKRWSDSKDWQRTLHTFSLLSAIPFVLLLFFTPRFLYVWNRLGGEGYTFAYKGFADLFSKSYLGGFPTPDITFFPKLILIGFAIGLLILFTNWKQYKLWLAITLYFFILTYLTPAFLNSPHYLLRLRALSPFIIFPTVAYFLHSLFVVHLSKKTRLPSLLLAIIICIVAIGFAVPEYQKLAPAVRDNEHINTDLWNVMQWIQVHVPEQSTVLFLEGGYQESALYTKRIAATVPLDILQQKYTQFAGTQPPVFDPSLNVEWTGRTLRDAEMVQDSFWKYHQVGEWDQSVSMLDFDYVLLVNIHPALAPYNDFVGKSLQGQGYSLAYAHGNAGIFKRGGVA